MAKRNTILSVMLVLVLGVLATVVVLAARPTTSDAKPGEAAAGSGVVVREDSHRLSTAPQGAPVFVEFLDFECESCLAAFPSIEKLRAEFEGQVSFVIRYFPIDSHANAMNAAKAVEAAAAQGKLEQMYTMMYETQPQWGEQQESRADLFREYASTLGLDLAAYDAAVADPATEARIEKDRQDGLALGVQGTPTFFLDGTMINPTSEEELRAALDAAVAK